MLVKFIRIFSIIFINTRSFDSVDQLSLSSHSLQRNNRKKSSVNYICLFAIKFLTIFCFFYQFFPAIFDLSENDYYLRRVTYKVMGEGTTHTLNSWGKGHREKPLGNYPRWHTPPLLSLPV